MESRRIPLALLTLIVLPIMSADPPSILFDHPTEGFTFAVDPERGAADLVFAIRGSPDPALPRPLSEETVFEQWQGWDVGLTMEGRSLGTWPAIGLVNAIGEVRLQASVGGGAGPGSYTATCSLLRGGGEEGASHTVRFHAGEVPEAPADDGALCGSCARAPACGEGDPKACGGRGTCEGGACVCFADFAGEECEHAILSDAAYLPPLDPALSPSLCRKSEVWEDGVRELRTRLQSLGASRACAAPGGARTGDLVEGILPFAPPMHGLGFNLHYVGHMLAWGLSQDRAPVLVESPELGAWAYGVHSDCVESGWACFFEPLSACDARAAEVHALRPALVHNRSDGIPRVSLHPPPELAGEVDGRARHGKFWWRSQLSAASARPSWLAQAMARSARNRLGLRGPYISAHVRMGDACTHAARKSPGGGAGGGCAPVEEYVEAVRRVSERYGCRTVFLATDSREAADAFAALEGLRVHALDLDRGALFGSTWLIEQRLAAGVVDQAPVVQSAVVDLLLLAEGDYLVASLTGHLSRLVLELMAAHKGYLPPYVSVEGAWCYDYAVDYGTGFMDFC